MCAPLGGLVARRDAVRGGATAKDVARAGHYAGAARARVVVLDVEVGAHRVYGIAILLER